MDTFNVAQLRKELTRLEVKGRSKLKTKAEMLAGLQNHVMSLETEVQAERQKEIDESSAAERKYQLLRSLIRFIIDIKTSSEGSFPLRFTLSNSLRKNRRAKLYYLVYFEFSEDSVDILVQNEESEISFDSIEDFARWLEAEADEYDIDFRKMYIDLDVVNRNLEMFLAAHKLKIYLRAPLNSALTDYLRKGSEEDEPWIDGDEVAAKLTVYDGERLVLASASKTNYDREPVWRSEIDEDTFRAMLQLPGLVGIVKVKVVI